MQADISLDDADGGPERTGACHRPSQLWRWHAIEPLACHRYQVIAGGMRSCGKAREMPCPRFPPLPARPLRVSGRRIGLRRSKADARCGTRSGAGVNKQASNLQAMSSQSFAADRGWTMALALEAKLQRELDFDFNTSPALDSASNCVPSVS